MAPSVRLVGVFLFLRERSLVAVIRILLLRMTMLSFRVPDDDAAEVQRWAEALGIDRSEILRDALHRHLVVLNGEADAQRWEEQPTTEEERSLEAIADWGPAEDWSDWRDAEG
jgi:predicted transcriptional regulator